MRANPNLDPYNLRVGMQICIPVSVNEGNRMSSTQKRSDGKFYNTQKGDTLTRILDRFEITYAALHSSNPNINFADSLENVTLFIPSEDHFRTCPMSGAYIVKAGDTLDSISKKLLVVTDSLLMANPTLTIEDFSIPDTKVCIPS